MLGVAISARASRKAEDAAWGACKRGTSFTPEPCRRKRKRKHGHARKGSASSPLRGPTPTRTVSAPHCLVRETVRKEERKSTRRRGVTLRDEQSRRRRALILKELKNLDLPMRSSVVSLRLVNDDISPIAVTVIPDIGPYSGGVYDFLIHFPQRYPDEPPTTRCLTPIWHPSVNLTTSLVALCAMQSGEGGYIQDTLLQLLTMLWYPATSTYGANIEAEQQLQKSAKSFHSVVRVTMEGGYHFMHHFPVFCGIGFLPDRFRAYSRQQRDVIHTLLCTWTHCLQVCGPPHYARMWSLLPRELLLLIFGFVVKDVR